MQPIRERQPKGARVEGETGRYGHPNPNGSGRVAYLPNTVNHHVPRSGMTGSRPIASAFVR